MALNYSRLKTEFQALPNPEKLVIAVVALVLLGILITFVGFGANRLAKFNYDRKEAALQKKVQDALSIAEAKDKEASAKETEAARLAKINQAKEKDAAAKQQQIIDEGKKNDTELNNQYQADKSRINGDMSLCDRCRDICARLDRLAVSNPDLAGYKCAPNSCLEQCGTDAPAK